MKTWIVCAFGIITLNLLHAEPGRLRAGAAKVDVTPIAFPVIQNGGFLEATLPLAADRIHARALYLANDETELVIVIVDSCMLPLDVCDEAKAMAFMRTGIPKDRQLIAATHTHNAPSVMDYCLGSRADKDYRAFLPGKIAEAVQQAKNASQAARAGWGSIDAPDLTKNRRWIRRPDKLLEDPFGQQSVRAHMHPGYLNPDAIGPSGPTDPGLSILSIQTAEGAPLAVLGNFSMHYFSGHAGVSADYFGRFCDALEKEQGGASSGFIALQSQGTSGDLWWGDYSKPQQADMTLDAYVEALMNKGREVLGKINYQSNLELGMAEARMTLARRAPDAQRLAWAREKIGGMNGRRPGNLPEVYAEQALYFEANPTDDLVMQAIRIGDLGIAALPNEVYALTGLKLKSRSPLATTFTIELANAACGYIPPPEQHALGGYTTWPARTAGLEVEAEPKIVDAVLGLLERVAGKPRRVSSEAATDYSKAILAASPEAYFRLGEQGLGPLVSETGKGSAELVGRRAYYLPGFEKNTESRAVHLVEGYLKTAIDRPSFAVSFWFWNGLANDARAVTAEVLDIPKLDFRVRIGGAGPAAGVPQVEHGGVTRLGKTSLVANAWHQMTVNFDRVEKTFSVIVNGVEEEGLKDSLVEVGDGQVTLTLGGYEGGRFPLEGKLDEVAVFSRHLTKAEVEGFLKRADGASAALVPPPARTPEESMAITHVRSGYRLELVAAEPEVRDPVALDWGADGRLWVAEMADYPLGMDGMGSPGGRVRWLRDNDGDGRYEESVVFLDGLSFPNGVLAWKGGVLITAAPEILYAEDRDGDGRADFQQTLFSGFLAQNQQLRVNGLRWGLDNWIHCASGGHHSGFGKDNTVYQALVREELLLGSRDFRFQADVGRLDPLSGPSQFGRCRDDWGNWFGVQNSYPLWHYVLTDSYLRRNPAVASPDPRQQLRLPANPAVFPAKAPDKRFHSFDQAGHYTSACGPSIYRDDLLFPASSETMHAFTCEPFHNVVQHHVLKDEGVSFRGERAGDDGALDFFASADPWSRPVMTRTGPDGALWIVDMYRYIIEHPDFLPANGKEELAAYFRAGEDRGRIYRVVPESRVARKVPRLDQLSTQGVVESLTSPSGTLRDLAHRLLVEKQTVEAVPALKSLAESTASAAVRLQALAVLDGLGELKAQTLAGALRDMDERVRREALRMAETRWSEMNEDLLLGLAEDSSPKVRLQWAFSAGGWPGERVGAALAKLACRADVDGFTRAAILSSAAPHYDALLRAVSAEEATAREWLGPLVSMGSGSAAYRGSLAALLNDKLSGETMPAMALLADLLAALRAQGSSLEAIRKEDEALVKALGGAEALHETAFEWLGSVGEGKRLLALRLMGYFAGGDAREAVALAPLVAPTQSYETQAAAIAALGRRGSEKGVSVMLGAWPTASPGLRQVMLEAILPHSSRALVLLEAIGRGEIVAGELDVTTRQRLLAHDDESLAEKAAKVFGGEPVRQFSELFHSYRNALAETGAPALGREIFAQRCALCHQLGGMGKMIGPDLHSLTGNDRASLLTAILAPNENVDPRHVAYTAMLRDGEMIYGLIVGETGTSVLMKSIDGREMSLSRAEITRLESSKRSLMPEGLAGDLSVSAMADLLSFLRQELGGGAREVKE